MQSVASISNSGVAAWLSRKIGSPMLTLTGRRGRLVWTAMSLPLSLSHSHFQPLSSAKRTQVPIHLKQGTGDALKEVALPLADINKQYDN